MEDKAINGAGLAVWRKTVVGMSQRALGEALGMTRDAVARMENNPEKIIPLRTRLACAALALGMRDYRFSASVDLMLVRKASSGMRR